MKSFVTVAGRKPDVVCRMRCTGAKGKWKSGQEWEECRDRNYYVSSQHPQVPTASGEPRYHADYSGLRHQRSQRAEQAIVWEIRVVDNPNSSMELAKLIRKKNPKAAENPDFKNMFRNAPTVVFIANDTSYGLSQIDCGLLGENMILSAWSMGIGSCCLGGPTRHSNWVCSKDHFKGRARLMLCYSLWTGRAKGWKQFPEYRQMVQRASSWGRSMCAWGWSQ